ncbi:MAG: 50S ribosomal protein L11 methyltransferase [Proteobacteria bacterium]|nr:50S ribosomal protein L11 methyltransferase [Burkholderiales bacterium]
MPLTAVTFELAPDQADLFGDSLLEHGALAVDVGDALAGTPEERAVFDEPGEWNEPMRPIRWQRARLAALFDTAEAALHIVASALDACAIDRNLLRQTRTIADADWVAQTQREFEPIAITDRLWIVPSWHRPPDPSALNLVIDPGRAFGSGSHPTTRLCLQWLAQHVHAGASVLDYGCGSGVLAIGAARLGAVRVVGVDIDPEAVATATANARANGVAQVQFLLPEAMTPGPVASSRFDLVVANILARPLMTLAPLLVAHLRHGGRIALAGLLDTQVEQIAQAYAPACGLQTERVLDGWALLAGVREH